jgi:hypothetical protein
MQDFSSAVIDYKQAVEQAKSSCRDAEEIHRRDYFAMVSEKCSPLVCSIA